ncbi:acyltransferase family protein [Actinoplanes palleronii]|uniref:Acyltransferase n=1 Tax=Actinoplanes palleronii TaxID=113570 RepID=A0ABQ4BJM3_9ACTN|nr:acyltransferase [Actinoplanes palleronii]GIE70878.1 acyltransferase [Actinoplanes palleronii]
MVNTRPRPPAEPPIRRREHPATAPERSRRLPALDGLRFLAALSVAVFHLVACADNSRVVLWGQPAAEVFGTGYLIASYGWVGVPLFFMISGFVICMSAWNRTPAEYGTSRLIRLYPAFWFCVLLTNLVTTLNPAVAQPVGTRALLDNLTMLPDALGSPRVDDVYWTLWVELKFYLLFLAVVWRGMTYRRVVGFCLAWSAASVLTGEAGVPWLTALLIPEHSPYFIAGIALCLIHRYGSRPVLWLIVGVNWALAMHYYDTNDWQHVHGHSYAPASILITGCFLVMGLLAVGRLDGFRWRGLTVLGAATYPLYLLHNVTGSLLVHTVRQHLTIPPWWLLGAALLTLTGLALLVHHLVERPLAARIRAACGTHLPHPHIARRVRPAARAPQRRHRRHPQRPDDIRRLTSGAGRGAAR